jgi:hypothetical protein
VSSPDIMKDKIVESPCKEESKREMFVENDSEEA